MFGMPKLRFLVPKEEHKPIMSPKQIDVNGISVSVPMEVLDEMINKTDNNDIKQSLRIAKLRIYEKVYRKG